VRQEIITTAQFKRFVRAPHGRHNGRDKGLNCKTAHSHQAVVCLSDTEFFVGGITRNSRTLHETT